jgi:hypothetical protein
MACEVGQARAHTAHQAPVAGKRPVEVADDVLQPKAWSTRNVDGKAADLALVVYSSPPIVPNSTGVFT